MIIEKSYPDKPFTGNLISEGTYNIIALLTLFYQTDQPQFGTIAIETRIFNNWLTVASAYATVARIVELPFKYDEIISLFVEMMVTQNKETARNDDLGVFWKTVQYLISGR